MLGTITFSQISFKKLESAKGSPEDWAEKLPSAEEADDEEEEVEEEEDCCHAVEAALLKKSIHDEAKKSYLCRASIF